VTDNLEVSYATFVASLRAGGFHPPEPGEWSVELVAAHVAANNDLIAQAAEAVARGEETVYDNAASVDEAALARLVDEAVGLRGLAAEVERSADRLAAAYRALGAAREAAIHVHIEDNGDVVRDGPLPIGAFIEGNASFHLDAHHEQIRLLQRPWLADPPPAFDSYQLVLLVRPGNDGVKGDDGDQLQAEHLGYFEKMRSAGYLLVAGPIDGDPLIAGISLYAARSVEEARALAEDDPAVRAGRFEIQAMQWFTAKDALGLADRK